MISEADWYPEFTDPKLADQARKHHLLPCFLTGGGWWGITPEGVIRSIGWEPQEGPEDEIDPRICNMVLFQANIRYPKLEFELPTRKEFDKTCPYCNGSGSDPLYASIDNLVCHCGGLGWIP